EGACYALTHLHARHAFADGNDFANAVGERHERKPQLGVVLTLDHHQIAVVERPGPHLDQRLADAGLWLRSLGQRQRIDAELVTDLEDFHGCSFLAPFCEQAIVKTYAM